MHSFLIKVESKHQFHIELNYLIGMYTLKIVFKIYCFKSRKVVIINEHKRSDDYLI